VLEHLISQKQCLSLFATHYHLLVDDWSIDPRVLLGHMDCLVASEEQDAKEEDVTFLYRLCKGNSPKSYGINVARLAGLPEEVITIALEQSARFEAQAKEDMQKVHGQHSLKIYAVLERLISILHANMKAEEILSFAEEFWKRYEVYSHQFYNP
jgi:DNA mismatch repair ATPase MutS